MSKIEQAMRGCLTAMQEGRKEDAAEYFTDNGVWVTPFGKFVGKEEIKHFLDWQNRTMSWRAGP